jgi:hypothetical protein
MSGISGAVFRLLLNPKGTLCRNKAVFSYPAIPLLVYTYSGSIDLVLFEILW